MPHRPIVPAWIPPEPKKKPHEIKDIQLPDYSEAKARRKAEAAARRKAIREATKDGRRPKWVSFLKAPVKEQQAAGANATKRLKHT